METENQGRTMLRRNVDKKPGCQGTGGGWIWGKDGDWKYRSRSKRTDRVQRHHLLSPARNPLYPQPNQDAVSMTTWLARKGGRGLQRKFSTSAGR